MLSKQEAFGKCWTHSPLRAAARRLFYIAIHQVSQLLHAVTVALVKIGRSIAEMLQFFVFSRWPPPPSWIFEIAKFYWLLECKGSRRISMPNFVKIGLSVAKILRFFDFSRWRLHKSKSVT